MAPAPPPRLALIPAREAPLVLVVARARANWTHLLLLNTRERTVEPGSWFNGQLKSEFVDLSWDGRYMVYAARGTRSWEEWTAISEPPWLKAITFGPAGCVHNGWGGIWWTPGNLYVGSSGLNVRNPVPGVKVTGLMRAVFDRQRRRVIWDQDWSGKGDTFPLSGEQLKLIKFGMEVFECGTCEDRVPKILGGGFRLRRLVKSLRWERGAFILWSRRISQYRAQASLEWPGGSRDVSIAATTFDSDGRLLLAEEGLVKVFGVDATTLDSPEWTLDLTDLSPPPERVRRSREIRAYKRYGRTA